MQDIDWLRADAVFLKGLQPFAHEQVLIAHIYVVEVVKVVLAAMMLLCARFVLSGQD